MATLTERVQELQDAITLLKADGHDLFVTVDDGNVWLYAEDAHSEDFTLVEVVDRGKP